MPKKAASKDSAPKQDATQDRADEPKAVSDTGRDPSPPDPSGAPMNYDPRGDAHPLTHDPLLAPEAQQPGESEADYRQRVGLPPRGVQA